MRSPRLLIIYLNESFRKKLSVTKQINGCQLSILNYYFLKELFRNQLL